MDRLLSSSDANKYISWYPMMFEFRFERTILAINEDERTFTVDIPMVMNVDPKYPPHSAKIYRHSYNVGLISDVGVENLRLSKIGSKEELLTVETMHTVYIDTTIHGWVSDVETDEFMLGIEIAKWTIFMTIQNCHVDCKGGTWAKPDGMRTGFVLGGQLGLVNNCTTVGAFHDFASGGYTFGPLQLWATGTLFDNILSGDFGFSNRSLSGLRPGWTGAFNVFYNCKAERRASYFESDPGTDNWIIGVQGLPMNAVESWDNSTIACPNGVVQPRSFNWSHLAERTGKDASGLRMMNRADVREAKARRPSAPKRICRKVAKPSVNEPNSSVH